jgi:type IV secretion system protein VirB9
MIQRTFAVISVVLLCSCSSTKPAPDIPLDEAVPARLEPEPARPVRLIEVPQPLPLPGQLKRLTDITAPQDPKDPKQRVLDANSAARVEPALDGYINAMQVWPFSPAALYQVYTSPGRVTDLMLQAGEKLIDISTPDSVRWIVGDTTSGTGADERMHIGVKPTRADLESNLIIYTDRRTYYLELKSQTAAWMAGVSWDYPHDRLAALKTVNRQQEALARTACSSVPLEQLNFRYEITGDKPSWRPLRAFDDGLKVYIQFSDAIAQGEMAPLFVIGHAGETQLVNYRVCASYYVVDRLFGAAELRLGGKEAQVVRIARTDVPRLKRRARSHR